MEVESVLTFSTRRSIEQSRCLWSPSAFQDAVHVSDAVLMNPLLGSVLARTLPRSDVVGQMKDYQDLVEMRRAFSGFNDIYRICFYVSDAALYINNDDFLSFAAVQNTSWYSKLSDSNATYCWVRFPASDGPPARPPVISLVRFILDPRDYMRQIGILRVDLREVDIQRILAKAVSTKTSIAFLQDSRDQIYSSSVSGIREEWLLNHDAYIALAGASGTYFGSLLLGGQRVFVGRQLISGTDLVVVSITPYGEIVDASRRVRNNVSLLLAAGVSVAASIFAFILLSSMVKRRTYELKSLQGQINPHFLYNTLDLINWTAINSQAPETSALVQLLSRFYKLSLSGGADIVTVGEELEQARSYVEIQEPAIQ